MSSLTDSGYSRWTFAAGLCMALSLTACPGDDTSVTSTSGSSSDGPGSTSATTAPNDSTGPGDTGPTSATGSTTNSGSSGTAGASDTAGTTGAESSGTTGGAESSGTTEGAESSGTTEGAESSGTTAGGESTSTTGGEESSGDTFGMETGVIFIVDPDVGVGDECDLWLQDCPAGDKCMPYAAGGGGVWDASGCFPIDPAPAAVGDVCEVVGSGTSGLDNCEAGSMCWDVDAATNEGTCVAMCTGSPLAPVCVDPGTSCAIANGGYIILCLPGCDPLAQDCPGADGCYAVGDSFLCAPDASGGAGADGDPCEFINGCEPGNMCLGPGATGDCLGAVGCCSPFCNITDVPDPCPHPAENCEALFEPGMAPPGYEEVGVCSVAP